jgi:hypothetical protein
MHGCVSVGWRVCVCAPVGVVLLFDRGVLPSVLEEEMVR